MTFDSRDTKGLPTVGGFVTRPFGERTPWLVTRRTRDKAKNVYVDVRTEDGSQVYQSVKVESLEPWPQQGDVVLASSGQVEKWLQHSADLIVSELRSQLMEGSTSGEDYGIRGILVGRNTSHREDSRYREFQKRWKRIDDFRTDIESLRHVIHSPLLYRRQASERMAVVTAVDSIPAGQYQLPVYALHVLKRPGKVAA